MNLLSRKFLVAITAIIASSATTVILQYDQEIYKFLVLGICGLFMGANVGEKFKKNGNS